MKKNLICIVCPRGCSLTAEVEGQKVSVTGQGCPRGADYAASECLHPMRTITLALPVSNREGMMISVKTERPIPKEKMMDAVAQLRMLKIHAPVAVEDVLCEDVYGSRVVATMSIF